jgi:arginine-tRNA-protein transferase
MRYKGEYTPSYLLDPGTNEWHLLSPTLDKYLAARRRGYIPFKDIEALSADELAAVVPNNTDMSAPPAQDTEDESDDSDAESDRSEGSVDWPSPPPPSFADPDSVTEDTLDDLLVLSPSAGQLRIIPYMVS